MAPQVSETEQAKPKSSVECSFWELTSSTMHPTSLSGLTCTTCCGKRAAVLENSSKFIHMIGGHLKNKQTTKKNQISITVNVITIFLN